MYEEEFPHDELPQGIIRLTRPKHARLLKLYFKYKEIGFIDFSLVDLAGLSLKQWRNRDYPIPEGWMLNRSKIFKKIPKEEIIRNKYFKKMPRKSIHS